jgi:hypothetical protein
VGDRQGGERESAAGQQDDGSGVERLNNIDPEG